MVSSGSDGSDKRRRITPLEAFFCILAALGLCAIIYATGQAFGIDTGRDQVSARQHYEDEKRNALQSCDGLEGPTNLQCVTKAIESAQAKSESRQDLYAQKDMADAAFWLLMITCLTLGVTGLGVWFVKRTLDATLEAVEDTGRATDAMLESNKIARETGRKQVRAYLGIKSITLDDGKDLSKPRFTVEIENNGISPANVSSVSAYIMWIGDYIGVVYKYSREIEFRVHSSNSINFAIDMESGTDKCTGEGCFILSGTIHYNDIFKDWHAEDFDYKTSGKHEWFNMDWPTKMSAFPLKSLAKDIKAEQEKRKSKDE